MRIQFPFSSPVFLLQAEGFCLLCACCAAYQLLFPHQWLMFAFLFLVPDLSLLAYALGSTAAATKIYNTAHTYVLPLLISGIAYFYPSRLLGEASVVWIAHISFDRLLGFGLKYPGIFTLTHIQSAARPPCTAGPSAGSLWTNGSDDTRFTN